MQIQICTGKSCAGKYSKYIMKRLENDTTFYNWKNITLSECLCLGECKKGPNIKIGNTILNYINPSKASDLVVQKIAETKKQETQKQKASKNTKK